MRVWLREGFVIMLSLSVLCISIAGAYTVWTLFSPLDSLRRGLLSILGWIVAFAASTVLFWTVTDRLFATPS